jgi:hypothetical protein
LHAIADPFLWQPLPKGQKRKWEDWEYVWNFGMWGSFAYLAVGLYYKPDDGYVDCLTN